MRLRKRMDHSPVLTTQLHSTDIIMDDISLTQGDSSEPVHAALAKLNLGESASSSLADQAPGDDTASTEHAVIEPTKAKRHCYKVYMFVPVSKTQHYQWTDLMDAYECWIAKRQAQRDGDDQDQVLIAPDDVIDVVFTIGLVGTGGMVAPNNQWVDRIKNDGKLFDMKFRFELLLTTIVKPNIELLISRQALKPRQYKRIRYFDTQLIRDVHASHSELVPDLQHYIAHRTKHAHDIVFMDEHLYMPVGGRSILVPVHRADTDPVDEEEEDDSSTR